MTTGHKQRLAIQQWMAEHKRRPVWEELDEILEKALPPRYREKFIPPTPDEVTAYSREIGYPLDGEGWCACYDAKDWKISGSTKMTNWQAAVRKWKAMGWTLGGAATKRLRNEEHHDALGPILGWQLYFEERKAEGLWPHPIPQSWDDLAGPHREAIHKAAKRIEAMREMSEHSPEEWQQRLETIRKNRETNAA